MPEPDREPGPALDPAPVPGSDPDPDPALDPEPVPDSDPDLDPDLTQLSQAPVCILSFKKKFDYLQETLIF